jgi:DNA-binding NarL/FixJ family response regulator
VRCSTDSSLPGDARPADLADAIRAVAGGDAVIAPGVTRRLLDNFASLLPDLRSSEPPGSPALDQLTSRERQVLVHVAEGMSNSEIAAALHVSEATVKSHLGRVLAKLSLHDRVQAVIFAYQAGLVHPQRPGSP